jgi:O-antigen ligase
MAAADDRPGSFRPLTVAAAAFLLCFIIAPMVAPALVPLGALVLVAVIVCHTWRFSLVLALAIAPVTPSRLFVGLAITGIYLLINASWSLVPAFAYAAVGLYFGLVLASLLMVRALQRSDPVIAHADAVGLCIGMALGSTFLLFELLSEQAAFRALMSIAPALFERKLDMEAGWVTTLPAYHANRSITALSLCLWPLLLIIGQLSLRPWKAGLLYCAVGGGVLAIAGSDHETSKLACIGGALVYAVGRYAPAAARWATIVGWVAAVTLVVPLSAFAYSQGLFAASWLPYSAKHRIVIWGYTAEQRRQAPLLGVGLGSPRAMRTDTGKPVPGSEFKRVTTLHSHNAYLQVWFETGAVGAGLLLGLGLLVLGSVQSAPMETHAHLYAAFATTGLMASTSFSLWAPWFMSSLGLVPMLALVGVCLIRDRREVSQHAQ